MASIYLVLKLEGMNPQYCTGFENARMCVCVCRWGSCEKNGISALKTAKEGVSQRLKYKKNPKKTEHSKIKQFGNNNNSVPKSKSILNKFEMFYGGSLREKIQRHTLYRLDTVVLKLS